MTHPRHLGGGGEGLLLATTAGMPGWSRPALGRILVPIITACWSGNFHAAARMLHSPVSAQLILAVHAHVTLAHVPTLEMPALALHAHPRTRWLPAHHGHVAFHPHGGSFRVGPASGPRTAATGNGDECSRGRRPPRNSPKAPKRPWQTTSTRQGSKAQGTVLLCTPAG